MYQERFVRKEYKYYVPWYSIDALRERILLHMDYDPFCLEMSDRMYHVRSIYYDTPHYLFYYEKLAGIKIRKKLRIRTYNELTDNSPAFLEIKRKFDNYIFKDRVRIPLAEATNLLAGKSVVIGEKANNSSRVALNKFVYLINNLNLRSSILVTYEREAFVGRENPTVRATFDKNVRSYPQPALEEIFREQDLTTFASQNFILELKFYDRMPYWARQIVRDFRLHLQSISKYCNCLETWHPSMRRIVNTL
ncbi:MAG: polyphosphate polymerase domain-containing protein [bacterium]|nr:polyphosphate polymerase domain-containing protein [bacterium]